jgi:hypothetical protein
MDSLEKLFLTCLTLFGMFILFLFGLYFDLGEMLASTIARDDHNATGIGMNATMVDGAEARGTPRELMPTALNIPGGSSGDLQDREEAEYALLRSIGRTYTKPTSKQIMGSRRAELMRQGVAREEVLELEALAADDEEPRRILLEARRLADQKHLAEALKLLTEALAVTNPKNLLAQREYMQLMVQLQLDLKNVEGAKETARRLYDTLDRVVMIRNLEGGKPEFEAERERLRAEKERLDHLYQDLQKRTDETGSPMGLTAKEKADIRDAMTKARGEGKMSEEEYQRALKELES